jgi:hypothetical protein
MFTSAFRFFAGLAAFSLVAAFVLGFSSEVQTPMDRILGPLTLGWKGGVGNHFGYAFFVGLFAVAAGLAGVLIALRDADPEAEAQVVHTESVPLTRAPSGNNYMPVLGAFAFVLTIVGLGTENNGLAMAGVAVAVAVAFVWTLRTWAERATGDDSINAELYHRFIDPLRTPVVAIVCIALVVLGLSRVLLAVSKTGSVLIFGGVAAIFFIGATLLALYPKSTRTITTVFVVGGALAILVAGIISAFVGERDFEHHGEEQNQEAPASGVETSAPALTVVIPASVGAA